MKPLLAAISALLLTAATALVPMGVHAQTATNTTLPATPPAPTAKRQPPKPAAEAAPGGGPDKVWVNTTSSTYHCFGDRYYGKTAHGRYMTEASAKAAGAHGPKGKTCPAS